MPINLITGLPGHGKSLYAVAKLRELAKANPHRPVFVSGIELTEQGRAAGLTWESFEAIKWNELPPGSIIFIDECQTIFRNRSINTIPPKYVTDLEIHRKQGYDLIFVTQHPMLIDPALRRLTDNHKHCARNFGMERSTIHEWRKCREDCDKQSAKKESIKHFWKFDKSIYPLYKSAEIHTVKRSIPLRVYFLFFVLPLLIGYLFYSFYGSVQRRIHPEGSPASGPVPAGSQVSTPMTTGAGGKASYLDPVADLRQYVFDRRSREVNLPHTAPRYDEITKPVTAPIPVACVSNPKRCSCYTQQATPMVVADNVCREIVRTGFFQDFDDGSKKLRDPERTNRSVEVLNRPDGALPLTRASTADVRPSGGSLMPSGVLAQSAAGIRGR